MLFLHWRVNLPKESFGTLHFSFAFLHNMLPWPQRFSFAEKRKERRETRQERQETREERREERGERREERGERREEKKTLVL